MGYIFILTRSVFQYYMFCVIYFNLKESQRYLRMVSFCIIESFASRITLKSSVEGLCTVKVCILNLNGLITSVREERANFSAIVYL